MRKPLVRSLLVLGAVALTAGCAKSANETPSTTSSASRAPSSASNAPRPTEKGVLGGVGNMPPRAYSPGMNAADGILALQSEGYSVQINWGGGRTDQPLSMCRIGGVDGLRGSGAATPGSNVFVTVIC